MAESDEEFVALGTPFELLDDDAPRKKPVPIHDQVVTDSRGRRRFHGAFTGGFSAGYFNTVDTKEGWTPKTFVSSRSQKAAERTAPRPEDFMDEDDLGEFGIAPKRVVTTEKFLSRDEKEKPRKRDVGDARQESGVAEILQDLIVPIKMSVGVKLLTQMGWKEGQGVGPRVRRVSKKTYGCAPQQEEDEDDIYAAGLLFAPKDVKSIEFASKDNLHGIGYSGINPKTALLNQRDWLGLESSTNTIGIRGQGFGVGALEEDDEDIYRQDNLSNYDIDLNLSKSKQRKDLHGWTGPPQTSQQGGLLSVFAKATKPPPSRKLYPPPIVPRDFIPLHKTQSNPELQRKAMLTQPNSTDTQKQVKLTAKERGEVLGEVPLPTPKKSVFDYIAEEDKSRLKGSRETVKTPKQQRRWSDNKPSSDIRSVPLLGEGGFKPFANEPDKQARYELFVSGKSTEVQPSKTDSKMTEWERECEAEEFARSAMLYRPLSQAMASRFTTAKDSDNSSGNEKESKETKSGASVRIFGALTRQRFEWHPDRVLCKRFNIPDPYPGSKSTGVPSNQKKTSSMHQTDRQLKSIEYKPTSQPRDETQSEDKAKTSALLTGFQAMASRTPVVPQEPVVPSTATSIDRSQKGENEAANETDAIKLAPMDLFKAVFAESSSESDTENSSSDEEDESEKTKDEVAVSEETQKIEVKEDEKIESNNDVTPKVSAPPCEQFPPTEPNSNVSSSEIFGPALPSSRGHQQSTSRHDNRQDRNDELKLKLHKKKKKRKSKKSKKTDIYLDSESDYEKRKKNKKRKEKRETFSENSDTDDDHERKLKSKIKTRPKDTGSDSSDSETQSRRRTRRKKEKKSKEEKKHRNKQKEKSGKQRSQTDFNLDDYVERTAANIHTSNKYEHKEDVEKRQSERIVGSELSRHKESRVSKDNDTSSDTQIMNKDILSKLKNIQLLKEKRRMRAADFM